MLVVSNNIRDTRKVARQLLEYIEKYYTKGSAIVIGLYGELGSGKTAFVKEIARIVKIKDNITSPTFVILKKYEVKNQKFKNLIHIDAYRLERNEDLKELKWDEILKDPNNIIFIEWAGIIKKVLPSDIIKIYFEFVDENTRRIDFNFNKTFNEENRNKTK